MTVSVRDTIYVSQGETDENGQRYILSPLVVWSAETVGLQLLQFANDWVIGWFLYNKGLMYSLSNVSLSNFRYEHCLM